MFDLEAGVVVDLQGLPIYWHLPPDRSSGYLPDTDEFYKFLRENRERISGVAHSHPGGGVPMASGVDVGTFSALERGLGVRSNRAPLRRPHHVYWDWWIVSRTHTALFRKATPEFTDRNIDFYNYTGWEVTQTNMMRRWLPQLRTHSYGEAP